MSSATTWSAAATAWTYPPQPGRLMAIVLVSVAAYDTEVRAERVLAGQATARTAGKTWGGPKKGR